MKYLLWLLVFALPFAAQAEEQQKPVAEDDWMVEASRNFGRVFQDPLGNFRGIISENKVLGGFEETDETAGLINLQGMYAMSFDELGVDMIPRLLVPIIGLPPESSLPLWAQSPNPSTSSEWGVSDIILQSFIGPQDQTGVKWGVGPQISVKTASNDALRGAGWGGGLGGVVIADTGNWGLVGIVSHMWGDGGDFSTTLVRPMISYNVPSMPGFAINSSPEITYNWKARSGDAWSIPLGVGASQAIPFSRTKALMLGIGGYKYVKQSEFGPEWQAKLTVGIVFAGTN